MPDPRTAAGAALAAAVASLVCCALPSLLVLLGMGATVAALVSAAPWLVTLSRHKVWVFLTAGALIAGSRLYLSGVAPRAAVEGVGCSPSVVRWTRITWRASAFLYVLAVLVAFGLGPVLSWLNP